MQLSGGKYDKHISGEDNKDNTTPRDGQSQQYNDSTPQTRGTRRRKIRDVEEQIACPLKCVQSVCVFLSSGYEGGNC